VTDQRTAVGVRLGWTWWLRRVPLLAAALLALVQLRIIRDVGDGLVSFAVGDPFGEADALRSAEYYTTNGLTSNAGLPNILAGTRYPDAGWKAGLALDRTSADARADYVALTNGVYTRYPPLPNLVLGVLERMFGFRPQLFRLMPATAMVAAFYLFAAALAGTLGAARGALGIALCLALPMTMQYGVALHYQGYAHAVLLAYLALTLSANVHRWSAARSLSLAFIIGLIQGALSFEYVFLLAAVPLLVHLALGESAWQRTLGIAAAAVAGFGLAHAAHLWQVASFHGSLSAAIADLAGRARFRAQADGALAAGGVQSAVVVRYAREFLAPESRHFGGIALLVLLGALLRVARGWWLDRPRALRALGAILIALLSAHAWMIVMPQHALTHKHILPRLYFVPFVIAMIVTLGAPARTATLGEPT
jgi:hypothetical protein